MREPKTRGHANRGIHVVALDTGGHLPLVAFSAVAATLLALCSACRPTVTRVVIASSAASTMPPEPTVQAKSEAVGFVSESFSGSWRGFVPFPPDFELNLAVEKVEQPSSLVLIDKKGDGLRVAFSPSRTCANWGCSVSGVGVELPGTERQTVKIKQGWNRLTVTKQGTVFKVFVNDQFAATGTYADFMSFAEIKVTAPTGSRAELVGRELAERSRLEARRRPLESGVFLEETFAGYEEGDPAPLWGDKTIVKKGEDGRGYLCSQYAGDYIIRRHVDFPPDFSFRFELVKSGRSLTLTLGDDRGAEFPIHMSFDYSWDWRLSAELPGGLRRGTDIKSRNNKIRVNKIGATYKLYVNDQFLATVQHSRLPSVRWFKLALQSGAEVTGFRGITLDRTDRASGGSAATGSGQGENAVVSGPEPSGGANRVFYRSTFSDYEDGDPALSWGRDVIVRKPLSGPPYLTSQSPGAHAAAQSVSFPSDFAFEFEIHPDREGGGHSRFSLILVDRKGAQLRVEVSPAYGEPVFEVSIQGSKPGKVAYAGTPLLVRLVRYRNSYKVYMNDQLATGGEHRGYSSFVAFRVTGTEVPPGGAVVVAVGEVTVKVPISPVFGSLR